MLYSQAAFQLGLLCALRTALSSSSGSRLLTAVAGDSRFAALEREAGGESESGSGLESVSGSDSKSGARLALTLAAAGPAQVYDPVLGELERRALRELGLQPLDTNEEGARGAMPVHACAFLLWPC
jgi:hypothetical protein